MQSLQHLKQMIVSNLNKRSQIVHLVRFSDVGHPMIECFCDHLVNYSHNTGVHKINSAAVQTNFSSSPVLLLLSINLCDCSMPAWLLCAINKIQCLQFVHFSKICRSRTSNGRVPPHKIFTDIIYIKLKLQQCRPTLHQWSCITINLCDCPMAAWLPCVGVGGPRNCPLDAAVMWSVVDSCPIVTLMQWNYAQCGSRRNQYNAGPRINEACIDLDQ